MTITFTTTTEVKVKVIGLERCYEALEALQKVYKGIHVSYVDDPESGYCFRFKGNLVGVSSRVKGNLVGVSLSFFEKKVTDIVTKVIKKVRKEDAKKEKEAMVKLAKFDGFVLTPVKNKYARMMDEVIKLEEEYILDYIKDGEYSSALCKWLDAQDLIMMRTMLETKGRGECYKFGRSLDTSVRERIPDEVYDYLQGEMF